MFTRVHTCSHMFTYGPYAPGVIRPTPWDAWTGRPCLPEKSRTPLDRCGRMAVPRRQIQLGSEMKGTYAWGSFWVCKHTRHVPAVSPSHTKSYFTPPMAVQASIIMISEMGRYQYILKEVN